MSEAEEHKAQGVSERTSQPRAGLRGKRGPAADLLNSAVPGFDLEPGASSDIYNRMSWNKA